MENELIVGIADIKVGRSPAIIKTNLGSCIAVCLYSPQQKVGGMLHLMMASAGNIKDYDGLKRAKFADTGIPELLKQLKTQFNVNSTDVVAKIFGGAKILKNVTQDIGKENEIASRNILKELGIRIIAAQTGGEKGYRVEFDLNAGKVSCQVFGEELKEY